VLLLDTCAAIWIGNRAPMRADALRAVRQAAARWELLFSPVSAWEIGLAVSRTRSSVTLLPTAQEWLRDFVVRPGVRVLALEPDVALSASYLPGNLHRDPADRLLVASARALDVPIVTRDERILAYAGQGHVRVIVC
jgi:PIN domain nuclease of toxin-antitoxin system